MNRQVKFAANLIFIFVTCHNNLVELEQEWQNKRLVNISPFSLARIHHLPFLKADQLAVRRALSFLSASPFPLSEIPRRNKQLILIVDNPSSILDVKRMFGWGRKSKDTDNNEYGGKEGEDASRRSGEDQDGSLGSQNNAFRRGPVYDSIVIASSYEKAAILKMFTELRGEGTFCDVAFLCQGVLFRAHRVVVSSWSRWLRALLTEGSDEEVVALDVFEPDAFGKVLDYMYGAELVISLEVRNMIIISPNIVILSKYRTLKG